MRRIAFKVIGIAEPKGSARAFVPLAWAKKAVAVGVQPQAVITSANPKAVGWQSLVHYYAYQAMRRLALMTGPVSVSLQFYLPRPASLPKKITHHVKKPDLDKLVRCTNDALTGVVYRDDSQIVSITATKVYAEERLMPHAVITVEEAK